MIGLLSRAEAERFTTSARTGGVGSILAIVFGGGELSGIARLLCLALYLSQIRHGFCRSQIVPRQYAKGHKHDFCIYRRRRIANVPLVILLLVFLAEEFGAINLRPACNPRAD